MIEMLDEKWDPHGSRNLRNLETSKAVPRPLRVAVSPLNGLEPGGLQTCGENIHNFLQETHTGGLFYDILWRYVLGNSNGIPFSSVPEGLTLHNKRKSQVRRLAVANYDMYIYIYIL